MKICEWATINEATDLGDTFSLELGPETLLGSPDLLKLKEISSYKIIYSGLARHYRNGHNVLILLVGAVRFELTTPCAQGRCATGLRYAPTLKLLLSF